jgi:hypothetical protein
MTKSARTARRADDWTFDMPTGRATHAPSGLVLRLHPLDPARQVVPADLRQRPGDEVQLEGEPWTYLGAARLPEGVADRRPAGFPGPGDANARGALEWIILAKQDAMQAAFDAMVLQHGPGDAMAIMGRIAREAGERWIFRVRLERGWTTGNRAS